MTDKELLELAAKAAGLTLRWISGEPTVPYTPEESQHRFGIDGYCWSPLTNDGDALRLAVKLDIRVTPDPEIARCECWYGPLTKDWLFEVWGEDKQAATRRAITRAAAAAEIGKTSP